MRSGLVTPDTAPSQRPDVPNVQGLAEYLRTPCSSIHMLAKGRGVPSPKLVRHWRFSREVIDARLASIGRSDATPSPHSFDQDPGEAGEPRD